MPQTLFPLYSKRSGVFKDPKGFIIGVKKLELRSDLGDGAYSNLGSRRNGHRRPRCASQNYVPYAGIIELRPVCGYHRTTSHTLGITEPRPASQNPVLYGIIEPRRPAAHGQNPSMRRWPHAGTQPRWRPCVGRSCTGGGRALAVAVHGQEPPQRLRVGNRQPRGGSGRAQARTIAGSRVQAATAHRRRPRIGSNSSAARTSDGGEGRLGFWHIYDFTLDDRSELHSNLGDGAYNNLGSRRVTEESTASHLGLPYLEERWHSSSLVGLNSYRPTSKHEEEMGSSRLGRMLNPLLCRLAWFRSKCQQEAHPPSSESG
ncbi:hypothetical protein C4D60_Mb07t13440 [Musa balbisiana]|uniref:Uncharacterized protein n=1 Tax=Musa balbisiana TaxID=52838 RepID=A0A4S8JF94_MUSBA|nr:hypothetical protein C4D60_Mb07t13440 [Musa balbisiana]